MLAGHVARHYNVLSGGEKEKGGRIPDWQFAFHHDTTASVDIRTAVQLLETGTPVIGKFTKTHGP